MSLRTIRRDIATPDTRRTLDDDALYIGRQRENTSDLDLARIRVAAVPGGVV